VHEIAVRRCGNEVVVDIVANAFVYHMVRNIAGTLIPVGTGERPVEWPGEVLARADRTAAGITAPAEGLYFVAPAYPDYPELPVDTDIGFPTRDDGD
jgi:tRNA pseudouridine38-40 synthase